MLKFLYLGLYKRGWGGGWVERESEIMGLFCVVNFPEKNFKQFSGYFPEIFLEIFRQILENMFSKIF